MKEKSVFLSYAREDVDIATQISRALEEEGFAVWRDVERVRGGEQWPKVTGEAIASSDLYHDVLFDYDEAYSLIQDWVGRNPEDLLSQFDFTERHFTTGRFEECERRLNVDLSNDELKPCIKAGLSAIRIANLAALGKIHDIPRYIDDLMEYVPNQPDSFKVGWSFSGTRNYIMRNERLTPHRTWLNELLNAMEGDNRVTILIGLELARASFWTTN